MYQRDSTTTPPNNKMWPNGMDLPSIGNATISVAQRDYPYYPSRVLGAYRPEQNGVQPSGLTASSSDPVDTSSVPAKRTATTAELAETPDDDDDDDEDDGDYDDYDDGSGFFEEISKDDSESTMRDDTPDSSVDSDEETDDGDKTTAIPSATADAQHEDMASLTEQLNLAKTYLAVVKNLVSKSREQLDLLDADEEAVFDGYASHDMSTEEAERYSVEKNFALDSLKTKSTSMYGADLNPDFQQALDNAAATFAEAKVDIINRHKKALQLDHALNYIKWERTLKELEIKHNNRTIHSIHKQMKELRQKVTAIKIIDQVNALGVEGIKILMATGNDTLEWSFGIKSDVRDEDEKCSCCDSDIEEEDECDSCHCDSEEEAD